MAITSSDLTNLIVQYVPQIFSDGTTRSTYLRKLIQTKAATRAGGSQWKFKNAGATASVLSEYDPLPASSKFTQLDAILDAQYIAGVIEISDESMDMIDSNALVLSDYLVEQINDSLVSIDSQLETLTVGGVNGKFVGLGAWALDTGSPAGISRASYSNWQAFTAANGAVPRAFTEALMRSTMDTMLSTRQGRPTAILMSPSKATAFRGFTGVGFATNTFNIGSGETGLVSPSGLGNASNMLQPVGLYDEVPVYRIPTMPSDKVWFLDLDAIHYAQVRAPRVSEPRRTDRRSTIWDISVGVNLVVPNPTKNCAAIVDLS